MKRFLTVGVLGLLWPLLLLSGCGFTLQTPPQWPDGIERIALRGAPGGSAFEAALADSLRLSGLTVVPQAGAAGPVLQILDFQRNRRTATIRAGRVDEYEWTVSAEAELRFVGRDGATPLGRLAVRRFYLDNPDALLARADDESALLAEMERELARLFLLRLEAALLGEAGARGGAAQEGSAREVPAQEAVGVPAAA